LNRLQNAIDTLNTKIPQEAKEQALRQVLNPPTQSLIDNNEAFHRMLTEGIYAALREGRGTHRLSTGRLMAEAHAT